MVGDALGSTTRRERPEVVERFRRIIAEAHPEGVARALTAMRDRPDSRPALAGIGVPVLALVGEEDTVTPIDEARVIADGVPDGTLAVVPKAGHLSNLENPSVFIDRIGDFLERHRAG